MTTGSARVAFNIIDQHFVASFGRVKRRFQLQFINYRNILNAIEILTHVSLIFFFRYQLYINYTRELSIQTLRNDAYE